jgi:hypothetical protein
MVDTSLMIRPGSGMETDTIMTSVKTGATPGPGDPGEPVPKQLATKGQADKREAGGPPPLDGQKSAAAWWWWLAAVVSVTAAAVLSVEVARGTDYTTAHRAATAWVAVLVVAALAVLAQAILLWHQSQTGKAPGRKTPGQTLAFRRRGLKGAVMGQDGRASTSKTQVALWTAAVVWALVDLLLLARAYPSGNLFTKAVTTNWRPEYLILLGLPVAAATTAKAAVTSTNSGHGPVARDSSKALTDKLNLRRVYVRNPVSDNKQGFVTGVAELLTGDDGTVAWADLQYVVFTLITLVNFVALFLARPTDGLPPVPAALLTLMGVSATTYAANKIVNTRGATPNGPAADQ